jgi:tetratricopeptide (TPR) repeat protein
LLQVALADLGRDRERERSTWFLLASLADRSRQLELAEKLYRACLNNPPPNNEPFVYSGLVHVLMLQRKYADVVVLCEDVLARRRPPRKTPARYFEGRLAAALSELGEYDRALVHADKAAKGTNDDDKVQYQRYKAQILAAAGRFDEAIRTCEDTLNEFTRLNQVLDVRQALSTVYSLKGDHAKSEEQLRLILEMDPDQALASNNLGYQMADRNVNLDEAERLIRRAIDLDRTARKQVDDDGDNAAYLDSLGWVLFRKGKLPEAREWLEKAAALPDGESDPAVWDHLGDVLARLDQPGKAKEAWQKAVKLYDTGGRRKSDPRKAEVEKKLKTVE